MKRIGLFLFFCILSLHGIAQVENDKDTLIIRQDKINEFINEMNEADKSMDFINEPPTLNLPFYLIRCGCQNLILLPVKKCLRYPLILFPEILSDMII